MKSTGVKNCFVLFCCPLESSTWLDKPHRDPEKTYIESRRDEREPEFAPPQAYYSSSNQSTESNKRIKTNPMTAQEEFGPPSDYFTLPMKKSRMDPETFSANLKSREDNEMTNVIRSGLSQIRAEVERNVETGMKVEDIPLPRERAQSTSQNLHRDDADEYWQLESRCYPGQFANVSAFPNQNMHPPGVPAENHGAVAGSSEFFGQQYPWFPRYSDVNDQGMKSTGMAFPPSLPNPQNIQSNESHTNNKPDSSTTVTSGDVDLPDGKGDLQTAPPPTTESTSISAAPVMYSRIGSRVDAPVRPRYERVNLHEVPLTLPTPPSAANTPHYPSQEEV